MVNPVIELKSSLEDEHPLTLNLDQAKLVISNFEAIKTWFYRERLKRHPAGHIETRF